MAAKGFLSKRCSTEELLSAVRTVAASKQYIMPDLALKVRNSTMLDCVQQLTKREYQIAEMLARGLEIKNIALELGLSPKTIHIHRANAMDKLNVKNNVKLAEDFNSEQV